MKVLIVEDEQRLADALCRGLRAEGYCVVHASTGTDGLSKAATNEFDAVILDIMLPGLNGYEVLQHMRSQQVWTPVLVLTALDDDDAQVKAFDQGADDYLTKPFSFSILLVRLRALIRRGGPQRPVILTAGSLSLDPARRVVERESTPIDLTPREYGLLEFLMRNKDAVLTKSEILRNVWTHHTGGDNAVEIYIGYLRRKIDLPFGTNTIQTIRGFGYRLTSPASTTSTSPALEARPKKRMLYQRSR
jgi:DNA-binding response OmpR family regulator